MSKALLLAVLIPGLLLASAIEPLPFRSEVEERRFRALAEEIRCTVCQNQSLADSDAPLAQDLRRELFALLQDNRSDMEIREFMVSRYGEFVLYRPPLARHTLLLWAGPIVLLLGSLVGVVIVIQRRRRALAS
ncbi:MAG: cytochrome c-type biogenesis protein CcmH [Wenzhouxiangella sp.]|nr:MAG: cytochrome c-type biogenesis protein CcmH [Wenzhouxiangella sp.]